MERNRFIVIRSHTDSSEPDHKQHSNQMPPSNSPKYFSCQNIYDHLTRAESSFSNEVLRQRITWSPNRIVFCCPNIAPDEPSPHEIPHLFRSYLCSHFTTIQSSSGFPSFHMPAGPTNEKSVVHPSIETFHLLDAEFFRPLHDCLSSPSHGKTHTHTHTYHIYFRIPKNKRIHDRFCRPVFLNHTKRQIKRTAGLPVGWVGFRFFSAKTRHNDFNDAATAGMELISKKQV